MLAAIEDIDVVAPVHADTADFLERPARREFAQLSTGSYMYSPLPTVVISRFLLSVAKLVTKRGLPLHTSSP
jgi:hypothetical protein